MNEKANKNKPCGAKNIKIMQFFPSDFSYPFPSRKKRIPEYRQDSELGPTKARIPGQIGTKVPTFFKIVY